MINWPLNIFLSLDSLGKTVELSLWKLLCDLNRHCFAASICDYDGVRLQGRRIFLGVDGQGLAEFGHYKDWISNILILCLKSEPAVL